MKHLILVFIAVNTFVWSAHAWMDIQRKHIQSLYIIPSILSSFLVLNNWKLSALFFTAAIPFLHFTDYMASGDTTLLANYLISTIIFPVNAFLALINITGIYILIQEFRGLENYPLAPAPALSYFATLAIVFF